MKPLSLDEVVVRFVPVMNIMDEVSEGLKGNHYLKPMFYQAFVRVWETSNASLDIVEEYILHLYHKMPFPKFKVIKGRSRPFSKTAR